MRFRRYEVRVEIPVPAENWAELRTMSPWAPHDCRECRGPVGNDPIQVSLDGSDRSDLDPFCSFTCLARWACSILACTSNEGEPDQKYLTIREIDDPRNAGEETTP
jgi:hypothetical protein